MCSVQTDLSRLGAVETQFETLPNDFPGIRFWGQGISPLRCHERRLQMIPASTPSLPRLRSPRESEAESCPDLSRRNGSFHSHRGTPIAGWFMMIYDSKSMKIPQKNG